MKRTLSLFLAACIFTINFPASAQEDWPISIAEKGCRFDWVGTNGYEEIAYSHGAAEFPLIWFSREDWGPDIYPFIPFCGDYCTTETGRGKMRTLFPLAVGKSIGFNVSGHEINISVERSEHVSHLDNLPAFVIRTTFSGEDDMVSWWAPDIGWIVGLEIGHEFAKTVTRVECPNGTVFPSPKS